MIDPRAPLTPRACAGLSADQLGEIAAGWRAGYWIAAQPAFRSTFFEWGWRSGVAARAADDARPAGVLIFPPSKDAERRDAALLTLRHGRRIGHKAMLDALTKAGCSKPIQANPSHRKPAVRIASFEPPDAQPIPLELAPAAPPPRERMAPRERWRLDDLPPPEEAEAILERMRAAKKR